MSTAHRPTWDPAQAKDTKGGSRLMSARDMNAHTKLKFRQPGQTSVDEVKKRDLRAELLQAEAEARNKKRKAAGLPLEDVPVAGAIEAAPEEEESNKRRKLLQEALENDKDADSDDEEKDEGGDDKMEGGKGKADSDEDEDDSDDDDEEDETAELLRELEKIKRERAAEKERQEQVAQQSLQADRDQEIATANPLLNLAAALGTPQGVNTNQKGTFAVKKRWDDDHIFKNQAVNERDKSKNGFVNDLLRTEFHKKFMGRFVK
ncbi:Cwf15/Cwc15 cell cycle control protein [Peniophora sp. CONT]|nr:Cwf15/Cwc15 cell cycle control protein [Peniophora sp. CONT]